MEDKKLYERNITLSYLQGPLSWGRFFLPVLALFYIASNVTIEEFGLIFGIFSLTILLFEVPSGIVADIIGKKKTLILSKFLFVIEVGILAFANGFWPFLIAKIISGFGVSLGSGANQALLYDSLKKLKKEKEHKRISANIYTISRISMAFVFILGAYLFSISPKLPAYASLPFLILSFILIFFLKEPYENNTKLSYNNSKLHFEESINIIKKNNFILFILLFSFTTAATISIMLSFSSLYFENIKIPIYFIGILAFISSLCEAYSSKKSDKLEKKLGEKYSLLLIFLTIIVASFLISLMINYVGYLFYLLIPLVSGFYAIIINHYLNQHIGSKHRATVLSMNSLVSNSGTFILISTFGFLIQKNSFSYASFSLFIFLIIYGTFLFFLANRIKLHNSTQDL